LLQHAVHLVPRHSGVEHDRPHPSVPVTDTDGLPIPVSGHELHGAQSGCWGCRRGGECGSLIDTGLAITDIAVAEALRIILE